MTDQRIEALKRQLETDPSDVQAQVQLIQARAHVEGSSVYLDCLQDRLIWNQCSEFVQDFAVKVVEERLSPDYSLFETRSYECAGVSHRIASFIHAKSGLVLHLIPGGSFRMGSNYRVNLSGSMYRSLEETPTHAAVVKPFLIGRFPVRQSIWDRIGGEDYRQSAGADLPIEMVSWDSCQNWLKEAGADLRLPSESEWEFACRAGSRGEYFWGESNDSYAWHGSNSQEFGKGSQSVQIHFELEKWNAFGLVDIAGNVWEWCQDGWEENYKNGPYNSSPRVGYPPERVIRGGSWNFDLRACRSAMRSHDDQRRGDYFIGFRVARSL